MPFAGIDVLPSSAQTLSILRRYAVPSVLIGGGTAGLMHLAGMFRQAKKDQKPLEENKDVLTVQVPSVPKVAGIVDAGKNALQFLGRNWKTVGGAGALTGAAALHKWDTAPSGESVPPSGESVPPEALADGFTKGLSVLGGGLGGFALVDSIIKKRKRENLQAQLDSAKNEYSALLGQSLAKTAEDSNFGMTITGLCIGWLEHNDPDMTKRAGVLKDLLQAPFFVPAVTGIIAHQWMYNRQKELEAMHTAAKPTPPKQIRLVSAPAAPQQAPAEEEEKENLALSIPGSTKQAEGRPVGGGMTLGTAAMMAAPEIVGMTLLANKGGGEEKKPVVPAEPKQVKQPVATEVAPGTVQISTATGPVEVAAEDPQAAATLRANTGKLTKLMAAFQAAPANSATD